MNKRISLINPYSPGKGEVIPSGVRILSGVLHDDSPKREIQVLDGNFHTKEGLIERVNTFKPDVLGVSTFTDNKEEAKDLLSKINSEVKIIGGPFATMKPEEFRNYADYIFLGESEDSLKHFMRFQDSGDLESIKKMPGIGYFQNNELKINPQQKNKIDLNQIPLNGWEFVKNYLYGMKSSPMWHLNENMASILSSRGCNNYCIFCLSSKIHGRDPRFINPEKVGQEIDLINNLRREKGLSEIESIMFDDSDLFFRDEKELKKLIDELQKRNLTYSGFASIENSKKSYIDILNDTGLKTLFFGIETHEGNRRYVSRGKKFSDEQAIEVLEKCRENGIYTATGFIIGFPFETREDIELTLDCMDNLPSDYPGVGALDIHPGTPVEKYKKYKEKISREELNKYVIKGYQRAYHNPKRIFRLESIKDPFDREMALRVINKKRDIK
jgi:anaerobic magnesium-protoporphyrin IX monomethyl ester cyclase